MCTAGEWFEGQIFQSQNTDISWLAVHEQVHHGIVHQIVHHLHSGRDMDIPCISMAEFMDITDEGHIQD